MTQPHRRCGMARLICVCQAGTAALVLRTSSPHGRDGHGVTTKRRLQAEAADTHAGSRAHEHRMRQGLAGDSAQSRDPAREVSTSLGAAWRARATSALAKADRPHSVPAKCATGVPVKTRGRGVSSNQCPLGVHPLVTLADNHASSQAGARCRQHQPLSSDSGAKDGIHEQDPRNRGPCAHCVPCSTVTLQTTASRAACQHKHLRTSRYSKRRADTARVEECGARADPATMATRISSILQSGVGHLDNTILRPVSGRARPKEQEAGN